MLYCMSKCIRMKVLINNITVWAFQGSELFMTDEEKLAAEARRELERQKLMNQKKVALETNKIIKEQQEKERLLVKKNKNKTSPLLNEL